MSIKRGDIVEIQWTDSCSDGRTWIFENDFDFTAHDKAMDYKTIGFFIQKTSKATYVCESIRIDESSGGSNLGHLFSIPNVAIQTIRLVQRPHDNENARTNRAVGCVFGHRRPDV